MRALIIDDEPDNVRLLALQLNRHCPQVELVGQFTDSTEGLRAIQTLRPGLVFLDIEMPIMNGFQLLERVGDINFHIVFVTAYDQYAVRAFRFSALDYLLKPIDTVDLIATVRRAETTARINPQQLELMRQYYPTGTAGINPPARGRIALPHASGMVFVDTKQIVYCEADSNYTRFHLEGGQQYVVAKTLGDVQEVFESRDFLRVHRQYMVNLEHIQKLVKGEGTYLLLTNGVSIPVARQQKDRLMERFGWV
ncbi:putative response regulatory protein VC_0693 [Fibrisoma limi BUZ 3]|uniref:Putative response regulatory protein VC_0693 n=1 Tax=Fibrisoma limi BUZ 3 TaxID=1185876 RepID=I2GRD9_9BACT|nr:LytTR family DNA-binding domain-containing protein [Fibrisoma limi]CCH56467.1 putative response regulatory protein VC_0693 [Fibrisoma limi BUZ 3]